LTLDNTFQCRAQYPRTGTRFYAIRVYDEAGKCDRDAEHTGDFKECYEVFLREKRFT